MRLKIVLGLIVVAAVVWQMASSRREQQRLRYYVQELETKCDSLEIERALLEGKRVEAQPVVASALKLQPAAEVAHRLDAEELMSRIAALKNEIGANPPHGLRKLLGLFEQLADTGESALPVIQKFLATGEDATLDVSGSKGLRNINTFTRTLVPATLRFGLCNVLRQIGGAEAEKILADTLSTSSKGLEISYLTQLLEEMAPRAYQAQILKTVHALLGTASGLDRDYLFEVLKRLGDVSYVSAAEAQLVRADGKVDRSSLSYLQQTLGQNSVALVAQLYQDARVTEPDSKESLARVALAYVGANEQAATLFHAAVLDATLKPDQRRELVEDLNQDGLSNQKNLSPADLEIVSKRYALTQAYLRQDYVQSDKVLNAAFREADKDLANMLQRAVTVKVAK
jgi:hypothetical protein